MKNLLISLAAAGAFGLGALGAAWGQAPASDTAAAEKKRASDTPGDKMPEKKAPPRKDNAAAKKAASAKKDEAERATRIDPDAPVLAASDSTYKCVDADGNTTYRNVGDVKGCKKLDAVAPNSVPFPRPAAAPNPARTSAKSEGGGGGAQRARDTDRRRILQEELAAEEKKLAELKKEFNGGEPERRGDEKNFAKYQERTDKLKADVARSESNLDSLRREISAIRD